ncbi:hypothetical protein GCM10020219_100550 [Nonomuraea dietziae]
MNMSITLGTSGCFTCVGVGEVDGVIEGFAVVGLVVGSTVSFSVGEGSSVGSGGLCFRVVLVEEGFVLTSPPTGAAVAVSIGPDGAFMPVSATAPAPTPSTATAAMPATSTPLPPVVLAALRVPRRDPGVVTVVFSGGCTTPVEGEGAIVAPVTGARSVSEGGEPACADCTACLAAGRHRRGAREAAQGVLGQRPLDDRPDRGRDLGGQRRRSLADVLERDGDRAVAVEGAHAHQALVGHHAEGVDVDGGRHGGALRLLGARSRPRCRAPCPRR